MARRRLAALLLAAAAGCGQSPDEPAPRAIAFSETRASGYGVSLRFLLPTSYPNCATDSVVVTGPGLSAPLQLPCSESARPQFQGSVNLGTIPPAPPLDYAFAVRLGGKGSTYVVVVNCHLTDSPGIAPLPGATVTSPVTFSWVPAPGAGVAYTVSVREPLVSRSVVDQSSLTATLSPGSYTWGLAQVPTGLYEGQSALKCTSDVTVGSFTVE
jgi:hypothetical protein